MDVEQRADGQATMLSGPPGMC